MPNVAQKFFRRILWQEVYLLSIKLLKSGKIWQTSACERLSLARFACHARKAGGK